MDVETLNKKDRYGRYLLHRSLYQNKQEKVLRILATPGIDVNIKTDIGGCTPLYYACEKNNGEAVKMLLLSPTIKINEPSKSGYTPILVAASFCSQDALKLMVDDHRVNLDPSVQFKNGKTLDESIGGNSGTETQRMECIELIKESRKIRAKEEVTLLNLLKNVSDTKVLNEKDKHGRTLLHRSLYHNNRKASVFLLSTPGIDVNAKTNLGCSPLTYACVMNNIRAVRLLLASLDIEVNSKDTYSNGRMTPIMVALCNESRESVKLLLSDYRVDLDGGEKLEDCIRGPFPEIYLDMIRKARNGRMKEKEILSKLLRNTHDSKALNEKAENGWNLLHRSLHQNNRESVVALLNAPGIDVNASTGVGGATPLIYACDKNNTEAIQLLLKAPGILVNKPNKSGETPIMTALAWCSRESLKLLVNDSRVDLDQRIKSNDGKMMDEWAGVYSYYKQECLNILYEARKNRASVSELQKKIGSNGYSKS